MLNTLQLQYTITCIQESGWVHMLKRNAKIVRVSCNKLFLLRLIPRADVGFRGIVWGEHKYRGTVRV